MEYQLSSSTLEAQLDQINEGLDVVDGRPDMEAFMRERSDLTSDQIEVFKRKLGQVNPKFQFYLLWTGMIERWWKSLQNQDPNVRQELYPLMLTLDDMESLSEQGLEAPIFAGLVNYMAINLHRFILDRTKDFQSDLWSEGGFIWDQFVAGLEDGGNLFTTLFMSGIQDLPGLETETSTNEWNGFASRLGAAKGPLKKALANMHFVHLRVLDALTRAGETTFTFEPSDKGEVLVFKPGVVELCRGWTELLQKGVPDDMETFSQQLFYLLGTHIPTFGDDGFAADFFGDYWRASAGMGHDKERLSFINEQLRPQIRDDASVGRVMGMILLLQQALDPKALEKPLIGCPLVWSGKYGLLYRLYAEQTLTLVKGVLEECEDFRDCLRDPETFFEDED